MRTIDVQDVAVDVEVPAFIVVRRRRKPTFHYWQDSASLLRADAEDLPFAAGNPCVELFPYFAQDNSQHTHNKYITINSKNVAIHCV
jgi:hypothetical protein